jgi:hypothetical protein
LGAKAQLRALGQRQRDGSNARVGAAIAEKLFNVFERACKRRDAFLRLLTLGRFKKLDFANPEAVHPAKIRHRGEKHGEQGQKDLS